MSAHVASKTHVDVLVRAALDAKDYGISPPQDFRWWRVDDDGHYAGWRVVDPYAGPELGLRVDSDYLAFYTPSQAGQILVSENVESVSCRYPDEDERELPGPCDAYYIAPYIYADPGRSFSPGEVFKSIDYLDYQSCEHQGWQTSEAYSFLRSLREAYCRRVEDYETAPWGFDEVGTRAVR